MKKQLVKLTAFILIVCSTQSVFAQDDFEKKYLLGKDLISKGKFDPAMEVLKPLTIEDPDNKFIRYAHYYYSLAALKSGRLQEASNMLLQLTTRYPEWEKMEEVNYLMANVYFEQKKYRQALRLLDSKKKDLKDDSDQMKIVYLSKMESLDSLINIQRDFPEDPLIAKTLAKRLNTASELNEKQRMLFEYLVQEFKLDKKEFSLGRKSEIKSSYNVAILFPFLLNELDASNNSRANQYIYDLYQGMQLAADSLKRSGVNINLLAYDTERSDTRINEILNLTEMKSMDLIIGPVYPQHYVKVNEFGLKNRILVINPLSENSALLEGNPYVYLFQPTLRNTAGAAARFALRNFVREIKEEKKNKRNTTEVKTEPEFTKEVIIFQSPSSRDSLLAGYYRDSAEANGFEVKHFEVISRENMRRVQEILGDTIKLAKISHIFVSSTDQVLAANIVSAMEVSGMKIPVVTGAEWLQFPLLTYDQYERRDFHFLFSEFVNYDKPAVASFKRKYYDRFNTIPFTNHAYQGYDLMLLFGNMLGKYGNYFVTDMAKTGFIPGNLIPGFNFSFSRSNSFVPMVKFVDSKLSVLNFPQGIK